MTSYEEIKKYLPQYLSSESFQTLLDELKSFPNNIDERMYASLREKDVVYQGDELREMPIVDLQHIDRGVKMVNCLILSNTCDMDVRNPRMYPSSIMYAPIISLSKYIATLRSQKIKENKINNHVKALRKQQITQIIFLPKNSNMDDSIVFLDRILHIDNRYIDRANVETQRLFSLSNYGFYMLLFKLSVHFSRILEKVDRATVI